VGSIDALGMQYSSGMTCAEQLCVSIDQSVHLGVKIRQQLEEPKYYSKLTARWSK